MRVHWLQQLLADVSRVKPRLDAYNKRLEYRVYEYDRGVYIVDVSGVRGFFNGRGNMLLSNWWALLLGLLRNTRPGDVIAVDGVVYGLRSDLDVNVAAAVIAYGTGTKPSDFTMFNLEVPVGTVSASIAVEYLTDRVRVRLSATLPADASEIGVRQALYDGGGVTRHTLLTRVTGAWAANTTAVYTIDFTAPWVRGVGDLMYGIHANADVAMVRVDGASFTARTAGDVNVGSVYVVASSETVTWSPTLYSIPSPIALTNYYTDILGVRHVRMTNIVGLISPAADIAANTLALYQDIYDTGGGSNTVCMAVQPLASPVTFYAGRSNIVIWRIVAL